MGENHKTFLLTAITILEKVLKVIFQHLCRRVQDDLDASRSLLSIHNSKARFVHSICTHLQGLMTAAMHIMIFVLCHQVRDADAEREL